MIILFVLLLLHHFGAIFFQSFYLHRYAAHGQFTMSEHMETFFVWLGWIIMGPSYLSGYHYGFFHQLHHKFADTDGDVHNPQDGLWGMMINTKNGYQAIRHDAPFLEVNGHKHDISKLKQYVHKKRPIDDWGQGWDSRLFWGVLYVIVYASIFSTYNIDPVFIPLGILMLVTHFLMGPIHGAVINYFAHKIGFRNHNTPDTSANMPTFGLFGGEEYHNNHHKNQKNPHFGGQKVWQFDPTYWIMVFLHNVGVIRLKRMT